MHQGSSKHISVLKPSYFTAHLIFVNSVSYIDLNHFFLVLDFFFKSRFALILKVFPPKVSEPLRTIYIGDVNSRNNAGDSNTCLLTLANRNDPICIASSKVAKASTISVAVAGVIASIIALTFANVNTALAVSSRAGTQQMLIPAFCKVQMIYFH